MRTSVFRCSIFPAPRRSRRRKSPPPRPPAGAPRPRASGLPCARRLQGFFFPTASGAHPPGIRVQRPRPGPRRRAEMGLWPGAFNSFICSGSCRLLQLEGVRPGSRSPPAPGRPCTGWTCSSRRPEHRLLPLNEAHQAPPEVAASTAVSRAARSRCRGLAAPRSRGGAGRSLAQRAAAARRRGAAAARGSRGRGAARRPAGRSGAAGAAPAGPGAAAAGAPPFQRRQPAQQLLHRNRRRRASPSS